MNFNAKLLRFAVLQKALQLQVTCKDDVAL